MLYHKMYGGDGLRMYGVVRVVGTCLSAYVYFLYLRVVLYNDYLFYFSL